MIDTTANRKELRELKRSGSYIAAFIGAGCSKVLNIPLWDELLIALNAEFKFYGSDDEVLAAIGKDNYLVVASNIEGTAPTKTAFNEIISKYSKPKACHFTSLHLELVRFSKTIVTTNYDRSFEETLECLLRIEEQLKEFSFDSFSVGDLNPIGIGIHRKIYHIHGEDDKNDYVLTFQSYKELYDNNVSGVSLLIPLIFASFHVLFVGFSFNDSFFVEFLQSRLRQMASDPVRTKALPEHYCIISDNLFKDYLNAGELTDMGIDNIDHLLHLAILRQEYIGSIVEPVFLFTADAEAIINASILDPKKQGKLLKKLNDFKFNKTKTALFKDLNIKPITFEGNDFLQIEKILRELNEPFTPVASRYAP